MCVGIDGAYTVIFENASALRECAGVSRNPQQPCLRGEAIRDENGVFIRSRKIALALTARHNARLHTCLRTDSCRDMDRTRRWTRFLLGAPAHGSRHPDTA